MDIKSKNKYINIVLFIISIFILSLSLISVFDFNKNKEYIHENAYFHSLKFESEFLNYFENLKSLDTLSKDYNEENQALIDFYKSEIKKYELKLSGENLYWNKSIRYYIEDKNSNQVYGNLENDTDIETLILNHALYSISFSDDETNFESFYHADNWFKNNEYTGTFIVLKGKNSQLLNDYIYYNSIKERVIKEAFIGIVSLATGLIILFYLIRNKYLFFNRSTNWFHKIPLDLKIFILIICSLLISLYLSIINFFYFPIDITHVIKLSIVAVYMFFMVLGILNIIKILKDKESLKKHLKQSFIYRFKVNLKDSFMIKGILGKIILLFFLTIALPIFIFCFFVGINNYEPLLMIISAFYILGYFFVVPYYVVSKIAILNRIIKGSGEIISGNLNYSIAEDEKGNLNNLAHNINNMKEGYKKSLQDQVKNERFKSELITNVSHDLKTPLTSIINHIDLLEHNNLSKEESLKYIQKLNKNSQRLKILIDDLFEASKIASGAIELNIESINIVAMLRQSLGELDEKIENSSLKFKANIPNTEIYLNLDGKKTWRVFDNLIGNILKYSMPNSRVYIDLKENDTSVMIIMKNMSSYEMNFKTEDIFERFKRGDKSRNTEGSGLGLTIAKDIVELQGGTMTISIDGDLFKIVVIFNKTQ